MSENTIREHTLEDMVGGTSFIDLDNIVSFLDSKLELGWQLEYENPRPKRKFRDYASMLVPRKVKTFFGMKEKNERYRIKLYTTSKTYNFKKSLGYIEIEKGMVHNTGKRLLYETIELYLNNTMNHFSWNKLPRTRIDMTVVQTEVIPIGVTEDSSNVQNKINRVDFWTTYFGGRHTHKDYSKKIPTEELVKKGITIQASR